LAQAGSVFNASSLWLQKFATRASYRPIDENLLRQLKSDQLMRQWVAWGYDSTKGFWVNPEMLSMADRGRADPKQDGLGHKNTAGVFSTNPSEKMQMASQFYPAVNATQSQNLNRTNAQYEQMLGRDAQEYQNNLQN
jgi:hypothetical protein